MTDKNKQDNDQAEATTDAATPAAQRRKPAYLLAREAAEKAEEEKEQEQGKKRAAFIAASQDSKDQEDGADITGKPEAAPANPLLQNDDFTPDLSGAGWITCSDGKKIRDDGTSIYAPGSELSPGQVDMILQLAIKKGWTEIYAFERGKNRLHADATQKLSQMIAARGMPVSCCCDSKQAGSFSSRKRSAGDAICHMQKQRHEATKNPAPAPV